MSNRGSTNHSRFRTKYWQQKHHPDHTDDFLDSGVVEG